MMATLRELRRSHGLTQSGLAKELGASRHAISNWERGIVKLHEGSIDKLRDFFGEVPDDFETDMSHTAAYSLRRKLGLTQTEAARAAGISRTMLSRIENGKERYLGSLEKLAHFYGVTVKEIAPEKVIPNLEKLKALSDLFRNKRIELGLSQTKLARAVGLERSTYNHLERKCNFCAFEILSKIADVLEIPQSKVIEAGAFTCRGRVKVAKVSKFGKLLGKCFVFHYAYNDRNVSQTLRLIKRMDKYLFFEDSGGSIRTVTQAQLKSYKIRLATEQETQDFLNPNPMWA